MQQSSLLLTPWFHSAARCPMSLKPSSAGAQTRSEQIRKVYCWNSPSMFLLLAAGRTFARLVISQHNPKSKSVSKSPNTPHSLGQLPAAPCWESSQVISRLLKFVQGHIFLHCHIFGDGSIYKFKEHLRKMCWHTRTCKACVLSC